MPVGVMLANLTSAEVAEYQALERLDGPIGVELRADLRAGIVASAMVNHSMSPPRRPAKAADFMPFKPKQAPARPLQLKDPRAYQALVEKALFGNLVKK